MNKKMVWIVITLVVVAVVVVPAAACNCKITGIGHIKGLGTQGNSVFASFGGNGIPTKDGFVKGEWNHVDHVTGSHFHGDVDWLNCFSCSTYTGPDVPDAFPLNYARFGGTGTFNAVDGCDFTVHAYDINEGGIHRDGYRIDVYNCPGGSSLHNKATTDACLYLPVTNPIGTSPIGCLAGGNFQIHPVK